MYCIPILHSFSSLSCQYYSFCLYLSCSPFFGVFSLFFVPAFSPHTPFTLCTSSFLCTLMFLSRWPKHTLHFSLFFTDFLLLHFFHYPVQCTTHLLYKLYVLCSFSLEFCLFWLASKFNGSKFVIVCISDFQSMIHPRINW